MLSLLHQFYNYEASSFCIIKFLHTIALHCCFFVMIIYAVSLDVWVSDNLLQTAQFSDGKLINVSF